MFKKRAGSHLSISIVLMLVMLVAFTACKKQVPVESQASQPEKTVAPEPVEQPAEAVAEKKEEKKVEVKAVKVEAKTEDKAEVKAEPKKEVKEEPKPAAKAAVASADMKPLPLILPKPMFVGTPTNIKVANLMKPRGKPRPPFYAPAGCVNLAKGKVVTSTDDMPIIGEIEMINDGDKEAADGSYVELGPFQQHITVDLEDQCEIYAVLIWHYHKQARVYFDVIVQVADDADFIENVQTVFNNDIDNSAGLGIGKDMHYIETSEGKLVDAKGVKGQFVRLYSNGSNANDLNNYIEIEVWGKPAGAAAPKTDAKPAASGDMKPLPLVLPKPMFVGTPTNIKVANLMKPSGKPRPPFYAPAGCVNLAKDKVITSTDDMPIIGEIEMMNDGDKEAADGSYVELGPFQQHVTIDLEAGCEIYAILVWHYHKQARVYFDVIVQVADDADFIENVQTVFNNDIDNSAGLGIGKDMHYIETSEGKLVDAKGVKGQFVRMYSNGSNANDLNNYIEIEIWGKPSK